MNRIAIVEDDQGYRDTLFTYIKQYEQERDTAFEATPFEKADDFRPQRAPQGVFRGSTACRFCEAPPYFLL